MPAIYPVFRDFFGVLILAYIDSSLVGTGTVDKAAIYSKAGDSTWAISRGFQVSSNPPSPPSFSQTLPPIPSSCLFVFPPVTSSSSILALAFSCAVTGFWL